VEERIPLFMGIVGPRMLELSGEIADGTVVSVLAGVDYLRWARERIDAGRAKAGRTDHHRVVTFAMFSVDEDGAKARERMRPLAGFYLGAMAHSSLTEVYGIVEPLLKLAEGGPEAIAAGLEEQWLEDLVVAGDPDECARKLQALLDAGSDSVILFPVPPEDAEGVVETVARDVLPQLRRA
jgi:alkanesulfonate monooxygenase SsuD/methylene tetrahydromethanopterin reductase-like flavin-dependent oxidoreductase (luciferase family)